MLNTVFIRSNNILLHKNICHIDTSLFRQSLINKTRLPTKSLTQYTWFPTHRIHSTCRDMSLDTVPVEIRENVRRLLKPYESSAQSYTSKYMYNETSREAIEEIWASAARSSDLPLLKWLHSNFESRCYFSPELLNSLAERGDIDCLMWARSVGYMMNNGVFRAAAKGGHANILRWALSKGWKLGERVCEDAALGGHRLVMELCVLGGCTLEYSDFVSAARGGHIALLEWMLEKNTEPQNVLAICYGAAAGGQLETLMWAREQSHPWNSGTCIAAAEGGHTAIIKWARQSGCKWDERACSGAARGGHLDTLKWLRANGCPWNAETCQKAAAGGHLEVLQWARSKHCDWDSGTPVSAAAIGNLDILSWCLENGNAHVMDNKVFDAAVNHGHVHILEWLKNRGGVFFYNDSTGVGMGPSLAVIKWLRTNGYAMQDGACYWASQRGEVDTLGWALAVGCRWDCTAAAAAATRGHLIILKFAKARGILTKEDKGVICHSAAGGGHLHVLKWARENDCPWDGRVCALAALSGHLTVLRWARANGCPWDASVCSNAAQRGELDTLKWATKHGCPWNSDIGTEALAKPHMDVFRWAIDNGCKDPRGPSKTWADFLKR